MSDDISRIIQEQQRQSEMLVQSQFAQRQADDQIQRSMLESARQAGAAASSGGAIPPSGSSSTQAPTPDPLQQYRQTQGTDNVPRGNETFQQQMHHIATNKNQAAGWTPEFQRVFEKAGMDLKDPANKLPLPGHSGPHPNAYHTWVMSELLSATEGLSGAGYRAALQDRLGEIQQHLSQNPGMVHDRWWS